MSQSILRRLSRGHQTLGIEVTEEKVKICEIAEKSDKRVRILSYMTAALAPGTIQDGQVMRMEELEEKIRLLLASRKIGTKYIHFTIPSPIVMVRMLKLPELSHHELGKLVQFEMKHNLQLAFEQPHYDFVKLPKTRAEGRSVPNHPTTAAGSLSEVQDEAAAGLEEELSDVLVAAAPMSVLNAYSQMFDRLKLIPCSFEIKAFSLLRLMERSSIDTKGTHIIVDVNETNAEFTILEDGIYKMTRNVEVSFKSLEHEANEENKDWLANFSSPEQTFHAASQDLISELERLMNFYLYTMNKGEQQFQSIVLSGDIAEMDKLLETMQRTMNQRIVKAAWDELVVGDSADWSLSTYAVPLGLALRGKE